MFNNETLTFFLNTYIRMFFLMAPFFALSMFVNMSEGMSGPEKKRAAVRTSMAVFIMILVFFFFGRPVFYMLGITMPAFQIGAGSVLFASSMMLILGIGKRAQYTGNPDEDFAVTPLAIPIVVGPGTIGTLMVWGNEIITPSERSVACAAFFASSLTVFVFLFYSERFQRWVGAKVISILTKLTALMLTALAAQIIFTGVKGFFED